MVEPISFPNFPPQSPVDKGGEKSPNAITPSLPHVPNEVSSSTFSARISLGNHRAESFKASIVTQEQFSVGEGGFNFAYLDRSVLPWEDFYAFAAGNWSKLHPRPEHAKLWNCIQLMREEVTKRVQKLLDASEESSDESLLKAAALYRSGLDQVTRDRAGLDPVLPLLQFVLSAKDKAALPEIISQIHLQGITPFLDVGVGPHPADAKKGMLSIWQSGVLLPDRDMYFEEKDTQANQNAQLRKEYHAYVEELFSIMDRSGLPVAGWGKKAIEVEQGIALAFMDKAAARNPDLTTHLRELKDLEKDHPSWNWKAFFEERGGIPSTINLTHASYLKDLEDLFTSHTLEELQAYLLLKVLGTTAPYLTEELENLHFQFFEAALRGATTQETAKDRCTQVVNQLLGEAVGRSYVKEHFTSSDRAKVEEMVRLSKEALFERIQNLSWMSPETKEQATKKLEKMRVLIGYPDEGSWKDDSSLTALSPSQPYGTNVLAVKEFLEAEMWKKVDQPLKEGEWPWPPQTVNASAHGAKNQLSFPAGILSPPIWSEDPVMNWGAFGAVISHEMSHCFDDKGRKYDAEGSQRDWWTAEDGQAYEEHAAIIRRQFDRYPIHFSDGSTLYVRGDFCLGENIADLGGLTIAYDAFEKWLKDHPQPNVGGFTPEQRFFLSWARCWAMDATEGEMRYRIQNDCHSPGLWRVNGPLSQLDSFRKAFGLEKGDPMWIEEELQSKMWSSSHT